MMRRRDKRRFLLFGRFFFGAFLFQCAKMIRLPDKNNNTSGPCSWPLLLPRCLWPCPLSLTLSPDWPRVQHDRGQRGQLTQPKRGLQDLMIFQNVIEGVRITRISMHGGICSSHFSVRINEHMNLEGGNNMIFLFEKKLSWFTRGNHDMGWSGGERETSVPFKQQPQLEIQPR